jgi:hypothetical protein
VLFGDRAGDLRPAFAEVGEEWEDSLMRQILDRVHGERLVVDPVELVLVEPRNRGRHPLPEGAPGSLCTTPVARLALRLQEARDPADRHAALDEREHAADPLDVLRRIKPVARGRAQRMYEPVTAFPGAQGDRVHSGQRGDGANGKLLGGDTRHGGIPVRRENMDHILYMPC